MKRISRILTLLSFVLVLVITGTNGFAQNGFVFKVLGVSGTIKKQTPSGEVPLSPGSKLNADETIIVESGYCGLLHSTGKGVEVKKAGTYLVSDLAKGISPVLIWSEYGKSTICGIDLR